MGTARSTWSHKRYLFIALALGMSLMIFFVVGGLIGTRFLARWLDEPLASTAGQLVFISDRDGFRELYLMNADGSQQTRLTHTNGDIWLPAWSPDGRYLAFVQGRVEEADIYIIDVEAALQQPEPIAPIRLTGNSGFDGYPVAWSPDSTRLALYSNRGKGLGINGEVWVMNRDGSGLTVLTNHPAFDGWPAWRPIE